MEAARPLASTGVAKGLAKMSAFRMRCQFEPRDDFGGGGDITSPSGLVLAFAQFGEHLCGARAFHRTLTATTGSSARRNTLAFFSSPSSVGIVGLPRAQPCHLFGARLQRRVVGLDGQCEFTLDAVYSWPQ